jgi:hypothetical protein
MKISASCCMSPAPPSSPRTTLTAKAETLAGTWRPCLQTKTQHNGSISFMSVHGWKLLPPPIRPSSCSRAMTPRSMYSERLCRIRADAPVCILKARKSLWKSAAYSHNLSKNFSTKIGSQPRRLFAKTMRCQRKTSA